MARKTVEEERQLGRNKKGNGGGWGRQIKEGKQGKRRETDEKTGWKGGNEETVWDVSKKKINTDGNHIGHKKAKNKNGGREKGGQRRILGQE